LRAGEYLMEGLRRANLPLMGFLYTDHLGRFVSLAHRVAADDCLTAHSLRNPDFIHLCPDFDLYVSAQPVAEIISSDAGQRCIVQFDRPAGFEHVYAAFAAVLDRYLSTFTTPPVIQVALSGGGDGRVLGECIGRYAVDHPTTRFHAIITANGVEDEAEHLRSATLIATQFDIPYSSYTTAQSAQMLGFTTDLRVAFDRYRHEFPDDEAEVVGTYWVQEVNRLAAIDANRKAIIYGFNQEGVIAERLFQALIGSILPPYPVRQVDGLDLIAPLCKVPKKLIDALDAENALRNYATRRPSVSYLRSSLYFLAYSMIEQFPALAAAFVDGLEAPDSDEVPEFLDRLR
jgi:hypothetical protein